MAAHQVCKQVAYCCLSHPGQGRTEFGGNCRHEVLRLQGLPAVHSAIDVMPQCIPQPAASTMCHSDLSDKQIQRMTRAQEDRLRLVLVHIMSKAVFVT